MMIMVVPKVEMLHFDDIWFLPPAWPGLVPLGLAENLAPRNLLTLSVRESSRVDTRPIVADSIM